MTESYEFIIEKDAITEWGRNFEKIEYVVEKILANNIEICQCFELASLTTGILRGLEKFIMQLCFHIGQFSNKKVHYAVPHPNNSSGVTGADD